jgi:hypothetical protein
MLLEIAFTTQSAKPCLFAACVSLFIVIIIETAATATNTFIIFDHDVLVHITGHNKLILDCILVSE